MKCNGYFLQRSVLIMSILISTGIHASAQRLELIVKLGSTYNTAPFSADETLHFPAGKSSFCQEIKAAWHTGSFRLGVGVEHRRFKYEYQSGKGEGLTYYMISSSPVIHPNLFADYKIKAKRINFYTGAHLGFVWLGNKLNLMEAGGQSRIISWVAKGSAGTGFSSGVYGGICKNLTEQWSIQAETGFSYMQVNSTYTIFNTDGTSFESREQTGAFAIPFCIGVGYRFKQK